MTTAIPRAQRRDKHRDTCDFIMKVWNEAVATGGMDTPGLGKLVKVDAPKHGFPITVTDVSGVVREYHDSLRSIFEQLTGKPADELDKEVANDRD